MRKSLNKLNPNIKEDLKSSWFDVFNTLIYYSYKNSGLCIRRCGICHGRWLDLLYLFIKSLNGCNDSIELLGKYYDVIVAPPVYDEIHSLENKISLGTQPSEDEINTFLGECFQGLRSSKMLKNQYLSGSRHEVESSFSRKFIVWLDSVTSRERIHNELFGSESHQFLKDMEKFSGDYQ
jgi:hypothetical protein